MDTFGSGKRPLTDVKEEPQERDEDFEVLDHADGGPDCFCESHATARRNLPLGLSDNNLFMS